MALLSSKVGDPCTITSEIRLFKIIIFFSYVWVKSGPSTFLNFKKISTSMKAIIIKWFITSPAIIMSQCTPSFMFLSCVFFHATKCIEIYFTVTAFKHLTSESFTSIYPNIQVKTRPFCIFLTPCMGKIVLNELALSISDKRHHKCTTSQRQNFSRDPIFWSHPFISILGQNKAILYFLDTLYG